MNTPNSIAITNPFKNDKNFDIIKLLMMGQLPTTIEGNTIQEILDNVMIYNKTETQNK